MKRIFIKRHDFASMNDVEKWNAYSKLVQLVQSLDRQVSEISHAKVRKTKRLHNKVQQLSVLTRHHSAVAEQLGELQTTRDRIRNSQSEAGRQTHQDTAGDVHNLIRFIWNTFQDGDRPSHAELREWFWDKIPEAIIAEDTIKKWYTACRKSWKIERQDIDRFDQISRFYRDSPTGSFSH